MLNLSKLVSSIALRPVVAATTVATVGGALSMSTGGKRETPLTKEYPISSVAQEFFGSPTISHAQATKKVWEHIKANNLQNPENKREIICDSQLHTLLGVDRLSMFQLAKHVNKHFIK